MPYSTAWCVGERKEALEKLLTMYKFERAMSAHLAAAELLHEIIPILPGNTVVVPVPTVQKHIRRRGYDHTHLVAKAFADKRSLDFKHLLYRASDSVQLGATKALRQQQASVAFGATENDEHTVLLIDDVFTTGFTAFYAAKTLRDSGTQNVYLAVIARQPLDKAAKNC